MTIARPAWLVAAMVIAMHVVPARAQSVESEVLFREGKRLLKEGKIAEACDKLEAADRLESTVGTQLNVADCREKNGQLATAWVAFGRAATSAKSAGDTRREAEARRREKQLEPKLSYLTISVSDASRVDGLTIARNGTRVDPAVWNQKVPIDSGSYEIVAQAPGRERWSKQIAMTGEGQSASVDVPKLEPPSPHRVESPRVETPAPVETKPAPAAAPSAEPEPAPGPPMFTGMRKAAVGVAAAGALAVVGGIVFGTQGKNAEKQSDAICPTTTCTDPRGVQLNSDARSDALRANIAFAVGGVAIAGAAVMWFVGAPRVAHDTVAVTPVVEPSGAGVAIAGRF